MRTTRTVLIALAAALAWPSGPAAQSQVATPPTATSMAPIPLASHPNGQAMMAEANRNAALLDLNFQFLNKTYENDVYARDPLGNRHRVSCVRFKATSGYRFKLDAPKYSLTGQGLTIDQNIAKVTADNLSVKFQLGPCVDVAAGMGMRLTNVRLIYKARPMIRMEAGKCQVSWSTDSDDLQITIGDLNITNVQNDIDKLAKDAVREALNLLFDTYFSSRLRGELIKVSVNVCGAGRAP